MCGKMLIECMIVPYIHYRILTTFGAFEHYPKIVAKGRDLHGPKHHNRQHKIQGENGENNDSNNNRMQSYVEAG